MTVTWTTESLGPMHMQVDEDSVMVIVESLIKLGFTPEIGMD